MTSIDWSAGDVHRTAMEQGVAEGWWPAFNDKGPLDWPRTVRLANLPANATMAHAMAAAGFCASVSQARKNGWVGPAKLGIFIVDKMQRRIEIVH